MIYGSVRQLLKKRAESLVETNVVHLGDCRRIPCKNVYALGFVHQAKLTIQNALLFACMKKANNFSNTAVHLLKVDQANWKSMTMNISVKESVIFFGSTTKRAHQSSRRKK